MSADDPIAPLAPGDGVRHLLPGLALPDVTLPATRGDAVNLARRSGRTVAFVYPWTGRPGVPNPPRWDDIPGAHGSTPEAQGFAMHAGDFAAAEVPVMGLSTQESDWQREFSDRLGLPFVLLSDSGFAFADALRLPRFETGGVVYLERLTLLVADGRIAHVFHPVPHPERHASEVLAWLQAGRA